MSDTGCSCIESHARIILGVAACNLVAQLLQVTSLPEAIGGLTALTRLVVLTAPDDRTQSPPPPPPAVELPGTMTQLTRLQVGQEPQVLQHVCS